jgi:hypothetical protein
MGAEKVVPRDDVVERVAEAIAAVEDHRTTWCEHPACYKDRYRRMARAALAAAPAQPATAVGEMRLLDRVEFALRDAGFDYDEAFRIAWRAENCTCTCTLHTTPDAGEMEAERFALRVERIADGRDRISRNALRTIADFIRQQASAYDALAARAAMLDRHLNDPVLGYVPLAERMCARAEAAEAARDATVGVLRDTRDWLQLIRTARERGFDIHYAEGAANSAIIKLNTLLTEASREG